MPIQAYILVNIKPGRVVPVVEELQRLQGVKEAYPITGRYDAIVHAEVNDIKEIKGMMIEQIHNIDGVKDTSTHIVLG